MQTVLFNLLKGDNGKIEDPVQDELIPDHYNQQTELQKEVKAGENMIHLELKPSWSDQFDRGSHQQYPISTILSHVIKAFPCLSGALG